VDKPVDNFLWLGYVSTFLFADNKFHQFAFFADKCAKLITSAGQ
jgi:hypothetical protein